MEFAIPNDFWEEIKDQFPNEDWHRLCHAIEEEHAISAIRPNLRKKLSQDKLQSLSATSGHSKRVAWFPQAFIIRERQLFATSYQWQAGYCYIQEPSSMAISMIASHLPSRPLKVLDLCAAPGGKSTLLMDIVPEGSVVVSNEPIAKRASILEENLLRWGYPYTIVSQAFPEQLLATNLEFDLILVDAPCSGEGMFRKSDAARRDWSRGTVEQCAIRQQTILDAAWSLLAPGGILLYSTCTFNHLENEYNVQYLLGKESCHHLPLSAPREWELVEGDKGLGWRAFPHRVKGEGFYLAALQKEEIHRASTGKKRDNNKSSLEKKLLVNLSKERIDSWIDMRNTEVALCGVENPNGEIFALSQEVLNIYSALNKARIPIRYAGIPLAEKKGTKLRPHLLLPYSTAFNKSQFPLVELSEEETLLYFSGEALMGASEGRALPNGVVCLTREGYPIGFANATSGRLNNLFPKSFRLRKRFSS